MTSVVTGRARVVYIGSDFIHLSKGGLDGKIVAYKESWLANGFDLQDWVTFKAKSCEPEAPHCNFGVRFKALPNTVKFEAKAVIVEGVGILFKVDEKQGQYGFIKANDGSTVYFTASVVRPETQDIRTSFKTGVQVRYKAVEQKQNNVQWRAITVCSKNATLESFSSRQGKISESSTVKSSAMAANRNVQNISAPVAAPPTVNKYVSIGDAGPPLQAAAATARLSNTAAPPRDIFQTPQAEKTTMTIEDLLTNLISRPRSPDSTAVSVDGSSVNAPPLFNNILPQPNSYRDIGGTGDAYEDAVRRLAYLTHCMSSCSCNCCLLY